MDFYPFTKNYTVEDALALGEVYDEFAGTAEWLKIDNDPKVSYAYKMRSILNEFERDVPKAILEFLRAYVLWMPPETESQVITWINYPDEKNNPIKDVILRWQETIRG